VSPVRLAATVILARPKFEIYLARRSGGSTFAPNAFVFPGGTIAEQDASTAAQQRTLGLERSRIAREFRAAISPDLASSEPPVGVDDARALLVAAVRELFEEAGVLLARAADGHAIDRPWDEMQAERALVQNGTVTFSDLLERHGWYADAQALTLFSHWITPPSEPRRYNTHFFFASAAADQAALADAFETHDGVWIAPADALERYRRGTMHLVYPTIKHLERLSAFASVEDAQAFARSKPVITIMPTDAGEDFEIPQPLESAW
jgi:8-oxo-dGTP pyrophosphatase MutT (NUDIX family)